MKNLKLPRVVLVTRPTQLEELIEHHGTLGQARFFLSSRGQDIGSLEAAHAKFEASLHQVEGGIPSDQRRVRVGRVWLDRFLFSPDDIVLAVGQDGLVANVAKYLRGQLLIGINSDKERFDGVLCCHSPKRTTALLEWSREGGPQFKVQTRTMAVARRDDGLELLALNEIFVGHRSHQSARYRIYYKDEEERHSSSGLICATGTGATGWARSISNQRAKKASLPRPTDRRLIFYVREPFPSVATGTSLDQGDVSEKRLLRVESEMSDGGIAFADGIESDWLSFEVGRSFQIGIAEQALQLVVEAKDAEGPPTKRKRDKG